MKTKTEAIDSAALAKEIVNWMGARQMKLVLTDMVYKTKGKKQFRSQIERWLVENPDVLERLREKRMNM